MMPRALFVVSTAGQGHLVRCRALANELAERGWGASLVDTYEGGGGSFDVIIVDDYAWPCDRFAQFSVPTVAIVDQPSQDAPVDLLVNGCVGAKEEMYFRAKMVLAGPKYALLREPFRQFAYDPRGEGAFDARSISGLLPSDVAVRMAHAPVTITRAGMRALEAACVGAPIILAYAGHAHEENQMLNVRGLIKVGAAVECPDQLLGTMASTLSHNGPLLAQMSTAGRSLVDGMGIKRVADALAGLVQ